MVYPDFRSAVLALAEFGYQRALQKLPITDSDVADWEIELASYFDGSAKSNRE